MSISSEKSIERAIEAHDYGLQALQDEDLLEALSFFKAALQFNPKVKKYWVSYIKNLIILDRIQEAKIVLNQVKSKGVKGEIFDRLEELIDLKAREPSREQMQVLKDLHSQGASQQLLDQVEPLLHQFPKSATLLNIRGSGSASLGRLLNTRGSFSAALDRFNEAIKDYKNAIKIDPYYADALFNLGILFNKYFEGIKL